MDSYGGFLRREVMPLFGRKDSHSYTEDEDGVLLNAATFLPSVDARRRQVAMTIG